METWKYENMQTTENLLGHGDVPFIDLFSSLGIM